MHHLKLLVVLFLLFCNFACKNKDCHKDGSCAPDYRTFPLGEAKDYLYSLEGSYWIYKNTHTGILDTQTCTSFRCDTIIRKGTEDYSQHITIEYERIRRIIGRSFLNSTEYYDETAGYNPNSMRSYRTLVNRSASGPGSIEAFFYPFILEEKEFGGSSITTCKGMDATLSIQGKTYTNVAKFELDGDDIWYPNAQYPNTVYYWAKDVGLIKRENKTENFSWELIDYHIIK